MKLAIGFVIGLMMACLIWIGYAIGSYPDPKIQRDYQLRVMEGCVEVYQGERLVGACSRINKGIDSLIQNDTDYATRK